MGARKWVFAVHKWETSSGKHDVSYGKGKNYKTRRFTKWSDANKFAKKKAVEMGLKQYQIDTPSRPHKMIPVKPQKKSTKKKQVQKRRRTRRASDPLGIFG